MVAARIVIENGFLTEGAIRHRAPIGIRDDDHVVNLTIDFPVRAIDRFCSKPDFRRRWRTDRRPVPLADRGHVGCHGQTVGGSTLLLCESQRRPAARAELRRIIPIARGRKPIAEQWDFSGFSVSRSIVPEMTSP